jgi:hypothetical protein
VAFSYKGRGVGSSCNGRHMAVAPSDAPRVFDALLASERRIVPLG